MTDNTACFKTHHDPQRGWIIKNHPIEMSKGTSVKINENKYNITPGLQKVFTDQKYDTAKSKTDTENIVFRDILQKTGFSNRKLTKGRLTGRDRYIKYELDNHVARIMDLNTKHKGRGVEKFIIPSNIIDIYSRLQILLGLKIYGHTDFLTEASNLIDELYKRGEIQNKLQYRNAINKFSNILLTNIFVFILDIYLQL